MPDAGQRLLSLARAAIQRYEMILPGDHIAVGVSGGKDSVALLVVLARLRAFFPAPFTLTAVTLDPCFDGVETDYTPVTRLCESLGVPHLVRRTRLWEVVFRERREPNPCSLCARMRRGALHRAAAQAGCNAVALGHHLDDVAETVWMNLLDGGSFGCFSPCCTLDRRQLRLIRPLVFAREREVAAAVRREGLPVVKSRCPADGCTNRQQTKELLASLSDRYGPVCDKLLRALQKAGVDGW